MICAPHPHTLTANRYQHLYILSQSAMLVFPHPVMSRHAESREDAPASSTPQSSRETQAARTGSDGISSRFQVPCDQKPNLGRRDSMTQHNRCTTSSQSGEKNLHNRPRDAPGSRSRRSEDRTAGSGGTTERETALRVSQQRQAATSIRIPQRKLMNLVASSRNGRRSKP
jgi:hypothetical protein